MSTALVAITTFVTNVPVLYIFLFCFAEVKDGQKRRRLEAAGQENRSPKPSSSRRLAELEAKPDTPIVPSVRSRVLQLTQRQDGNYYYYTLPIFIYPHFCQ